MLYNADLFSAFGLQRSILIFSSSFLYRRRDKFQQCDRHTIICDGADMDANEEKAKE
jgi:hypothetical protein